MNNSFFSSAQAADPFYNRIRDNLNPDYNGARDFVETMWQKYEPYAEPDFIEDAKKDFHAKTWEMYLGCLFLNHGFNLQKKVKKEGTDLHLIWNDQSICIEAVAPTSGKGDNAIPETKDFEVYDVPQEKILLRFRGAIEEKYKAYKEHIKKGLINHDHYYVIAVNGGRVRHSIQEQDIPYIVKCVLPFGNQAVTIDKTSSKIVNSYYKYRDTITTYKGSPVCTNIFKDKNYSGITAILYSWMNIVTRPNRIGVEVHIVHNPIADNKLPHGIFPIGTEWWIENNQLIRKDHNEKEIAG